MNGYFKFDTAEVKVFACLFPKLKTIIKAAFYDDISATEAAGTEHAATEHSYK